MLADSRHPTPQPSTPATPRGRLPFLPHSTGASPQYSTRASSESATSAESDHHISAGAFTPGYFDKFFHVERELGRGGRGVVLLVRHELDGIMLGRFAIKRIPVGDDRNWLEHVLMEVSMLQDISHKNLVAYRHVWLEDHKPSAFGPSIPHVYIMQQYCNGGTLFQHVLGPENKAAVRDALKDRLRKRSKGAMDLPNDMHSPRRLPFEKIYSFFKDITSGVAHLHSKGLVHRDLKPQNCLLHHTGDSVRVLVSDFGEMQASTTRRGPTATGYTGTISFAAPEVLRRATDGTFGDFTPKSDVFSLGMIVYFMCFARLPYDSADDAMREENEDIEQLRVEISAWTGLNINSNDRADLPDALYKYLEKLLSDDPEERPGTEDILHTIKANAGLNDEKGFSSARNPRTTSPPTSPDSNRQATQLEGQNASVEDDVEPSLYQRRSRSKDQQLPEQMWHIATSKTKSISSPTSAALIRSPHRDSPSALSSGRQLLLPAPPRRWHQRLLDSLSFQAVPAEVGTFMRLVVLLLKVWSLLQPCAPSATNTNLLYPLLLVAALDLTHTMPLAGSAGFAVIHVGVLVMARRTGSLCVPKLPDWRRGG